MWSFAQEDLPAADGLMSIWKADDLLNPVSRSKEEIVGR
jgi:hypothetical protein